MAVFGTAQTGLIETVKGNVGDQKRIHRHTAVGSDYVL